MNAFAKLALCAAFAILSGLAGAQSALPRVVWVSPTESGQGGPFFEELRRGLRMPPSILVRADRMIE